MNQPSPIEQHLSRTSQNHQKRANKCQADVANPPLHQSSTTPKTPKLSSNIQRSRPDTNKHGITDQEINEINHQPAPLITNFHKSKVHIISHHNTTPKFPSFAEDERTTRHSSFIHHSSSTSSASAVQSRPESPRIVEMRIESGSKRRSAAKEGKGRKDDE
jgi:hypothetical protein